MTMLPPLYYNIYMGRKRLLEETILQRIKERPKCSIENCNNLATTKNKSNGTFRKLCSKHHKRKYGMFTNSKYYRKVRDFPNGVCSLCSWKGPCDRHRLLYGKEGGAYIKGNVVILCPNCHRLLHLGRLTLH